MARSRTRKSTQSKTVRFVKNARPAAGRKPTAARRRTPSPRTTQRKAPPRTSSSTRLPGWGELEKANRKEGNRRGAWDRLFASVSTVRLILYILGTAIVATLYVGHVLATQRLAENVRALREDNLELHLRYNRVKGAFDRASGPALIHERARALGLSESLPNGYPVIID